MCVSVRAYVWVCLCVACILHPCIRPTWRVLPRLAHVINEVHNSLCLITLNSHLLNVKLDVYVPASSHQNWCHVSLFLAVKINMYFPIFFPSMLVCYKFVIPGLLKSVTDIVLKLKNELWADTMLLWVLFRPERYPWSQDTLICCLQQWLLLWQSASFVYFFPILLITTGNTIVIPCLWAKL